MSRRSLVGHLHICETQAKRTRVHRSKTGRPLAQRTPISQPTKKRVRDLRHRTRFKIFQQTLWQLLDHDVLVEGRAHWVMALNGKGAFGEFTTGHSLQFLRRIPAFGLGEVHRHLAVDG